MLSNNATFFDQKFISKNEAIVHDILKEKNIALSLKREDDIDPMISGNKYRKLKYNLLEAKQFGHKTVLTFGGAFSNHILATSKAAKVMGFQSIGVIRGEELGKDIAKTMAENATLKTAALNGMTFEFVSREVYRKKEDRNFLQRLTEKYGDFYGIPEGGTNNLAVDGCKEILTENDNSFDYICTSVGTGGTLSGLILSAEAHQKILGFPALKGDFLEKEVQQYVGNVGNWSLVKNYHFGGYAKYNDALIRFINTFKQDHEIQLDPIYTGKMLYGIFDMVKNNQFERGAKILAIHTGGLQGIEGFNQRLIRNKRQIRIEL